MLPLPPSAERQGRVTYEQENVEGCQENPPASERWESGVPIEMRVPVVVVEATLLDLPGTVSEYGSTNSQEAGTGMSAASSSTQHGVAMSVLSNQSQTSQMSAASGVTGISAQSSAKSAWRSKRSLSAEESASRHVRIAEEEVLQRAHRTTMRIAEDTTRMRTKKEKHRPRRNSVQSTTDTTPTNGTDQLPDRVGTPTSGSRGISWFLPSSAETMQLHKIRSESLGNTGSSGRRAASPEVDDGLPAISQSWLGTTSSGASASNDHEGMLSDSDNEDGDSDEDKGQLTPMKSTQPGWPHGDKESGKVGDDDGDAVHRLARVTSYFFLGCCSCAAVQTAVMLYVYFAEPLGRAPQTYDLAPAWLYMAVLGTMLLALALRLDWSSRKAQVMAGVLLLVSPAGLLGGFEREDHIETAVLWSFLAVLLRCTSASLSNHDWLVWYALYLAVVIGNNLYILLASGDMFDREHVEYPWWHELLLGLNHVLATSLFMLPLGLTASDLLADEEKAVKYLLEVQQQERLESLLLTALVPTEVSERFLMADRLIADNYHEATALFIYVCDYEAVMLEYGADMTIVWVNSIFTCLDHCIEQFPRQSVTKVETFNNFLLAFSGVLEPDEDEPAQSHSQQHAERCMALAVHMLQAAANVERPGGKPTYLKVGLSSGPICAGVICGLGSPRYSIFGDAVNTASRMASNSMPCTASNPYIHFSAATHETLHDDFCRELEISEGLHVAPRGDGIEIKGKGKMQTYCLTQHLEPDSALWAEAPDSEHVIQGPKTAAGPGAQEEIRGAPPSGQL